MGNLRLILNYAAKDLWQQKVKTILGLIGVMISVGLLAIVLFVSDSISISFVDYLAQDAGNQDIVVTVRHYNGEPYNRSTYFYYDPVIEEIEDATDKIGEYIPRMEVEGNVNISEGFDTTDLTNQQENTMISGIDLSYENKINFGRFVDRKTQEVNEIKKLPLYHCAIYYGFNDIIKYKKGENITVYMSLTHNNRQAKVLKTVELVIDEIFDFKLKWPEDYRAENLIVVDIKTLYTIFGYEEFEDRCSKLIMTFASGDEVYDVRDTESSEKEVKSIAADIQLAIGLSEYYVDLPKLEILGYSEYLSMGITVIFVFVSIIAMLIAGILINGILKTSVEERIREFGIFRTLGGYKKQNLGIVLMQGFLLCGAGTLFGILGAFFGTQFVLIPAANELLLNQYIEGGITFSWSLTSIMIAAVMGISVGMIVSLSPALKVMRLQLIESIHPYRHEDTLYHLQKRSSVNYKLIIVGIILAANGGFIYFVIPRLLVSMNMALMAGTLISILLIFLIGLTLAGLGLMPIILRATIQAFRPLSKRLHHVIKIFVFRYQRRNSSTIIIFALSFSFVMFTSTVLQTQSAQVSVLIKLRYGSDLVMETTGWERESWGGGGMMGGGDDDDGGGFFNLALGQTSYESFSYDTTANIQADEFDIDPTRVLDITFKEKLLTIEGIEKVSAVLASPWQLTQIYSEGGKEFGAEIADYAGLSSESISLFGIDEEYSSTIDAEFITFTRGEIDEAFDKIFNNKTEYTCIVTEGLALELKLELNEKVRIVIERGDELESYPFRIVGCASSMPGFPWEFGGSRYSADDGGVLVSHDTYIQLMEIPNLAYVDRFFIKLQENKLSTATDIEQEIDDQWKNDYDYELYNLERRVSMAEDAFAVIDALFMVILMATVVICLFGLLSSSYSTIIERKKEIGVVRTLGLKGREINKMFILEALIILIASGTVGVLVGWMTGWLLSSNLNLFTDMPYQPQFPWINLLVLYGVSVSFVLIGMRLLLRKSRKQKIVEIYRETM